MTNRWAGRGKRAWALGGALLLCGSALLLPGGDLARADATSQPTSGGGGTSGGGVRNHDGRVLPPPPPAPKQPVLFNTPEADDILAALQVYPKDNPWNEDISKRPVHPDSAKMIAQIGAKKKLAYNLDMGFIIVPPDQKKIDVKIKSTSESDPGPYPLPDGTPVEGWPLNRETLDEIQRNGKGDRHMIVLDPWNGKEYDFYQGLKTNAGWQATCEATFDLTSNKLRPKGWTSSDAAGLPLFPAVVRFDEVGRGMVEHALRFTVRHTTAEFIPPATHEAGKGKDPAVPAMGQRFRLKATASLTGLAKHPLAVAKGLQKYGMFVADNGGDWRISVAPDKRIKDLEQLGRFTGNDFEVVQTTSENEGPRKH